MMKRHAEGRKSEKKNTLARVLITIWAVIMVICLAGAGVFVYMYHSGRGRFAVDPSETVPIDAPDGAVTDESGVTYNDKHYVYNTNIVTILVMGVDRETMDSNGEIGFNGQSDANFLVALDTKTGKISMISVSRDAMVDVNVYTRLGGFVKTDRMQLCLAYAYGDGRETSCKNVVRSVSRLFYNIPVHCYAAIDMEGVSRIVDAVGGVTVPEYTADGTEKTGRDITLDGYNAQLYLRSRDKSNIDSSSLRLGHQNDFISAFLSKIQTMAREEITGTLSLYGIAKNYAVTDISAPQLAFLVTNYIGGVTEMKKYTVPGAMTVGGDHSEYNVDTDALYDIILEVFYNYE